MKKIWLILLMMGITSSYSNVYLGLEVGKGLIKDAPTESLNEGSLFGTSIYKRFISDSLMLDAGIKYQSITHTITYDSGPYSTGNLNKNLMSVKLSPGYYFTKNIGLTLENTIYTNKLQIAEKEFQKGSTGLGLFFEHSLSKNFLSKSSISYNKGWNSNKKYDYVILF